MEIGKRLHVTTAAEWRDWLERYAGTEREIWLVFHKKTAKTPGLEYSAAVEEALCFGWIDGQLKSIDLETFARRFSPRRPNTSWSGSNRELARRLIESGRMTDRGRPALPADLLP